MKKNNILIVGVFDLFHRGHLEFLKKTAAIGGDLYMLINGDELTAKYKRRPIYSEEDRCAIIEALSFVKAAEVTNSYDIKPFIEKHDINVILHGDDWEHESYLKQICVTEEYLAERDIKIEYTPYYKGVSTSDIIKRIKEM